MICIFNRNPNIFHIFSTYKHENFFPKKLQYYCFVTKKSYSITSFTIKHHSPIINLFFCNKKE
ncbi:hypothetical protein COF80_24735 [Bacillus toyonensis]|nr:hypothetical protein CN586_21810 [Bacillus toyonensis]PEM46322.1 hypothetical protein CN636_07160 [Bacillus toyonensis]PHE83354.1 hypothetical protein COF80_24735 [Bacillus toyonensis]